MPGSKQGAAPEKELPLCYDIIELSEKLQQIVKSAGITSGTITAFVPGSTAGMTTIEYEPGLIQDFKDAFKRIAPRSRDIVVQLIGQSA